MPSTVELINKMEMNADGWNRVGEKGLLSILNEAQNILLRQECAQRQIVRSDGKLPYIATTDETYQYSLSQAVTGLSVDIWRVAQVMVRAPFSANLQSITSIDYGIRPENRQPIQSLEFNGIEYFRFHQVATKDALYGGDPTIYFTTNPGDSTEDFYLLCYQDPVQMTSESINPEVPEQYHYTILLPTALKLLEAHQNGNWVEALGMIEEQFKPKMQAELNESDQGEWTSIARIEF